MDRVKAFRAAMEAAEYLGEAGLSKPDDCEYARTLAVRLLDAAAFMLGPWIPNYTCADCLKVFEGDCMLVFCPACGQKRWNDSQTARETVVIEDGRTATVEATIPVVTTESTVTGQLLNWQTILMDVDELPF